MRIAISGGGTAGHVYPGLALADALKSDAPLADILFVGVENGLEAELVPKAGFRLEVLNLQRFKRRVSFRNLTSLFLLMKGFKKALAILKDFQPDVVVGFGGFVSVPLIAAALFLKKPVVLHEANAHPGTANRLMARGAKVVAISFPEAADYFYGRKDLVLTGMPIRPDILKGTRKEAAEALGIDPDVKTILIFGGSLGAHAVNQATVDALPRFSSLCPLQILHLTGMIDFDQIQTQVKTLGNLDEQIVYRCLAYLDRMNLAYAVSDLIVARAGASTIAEITAREIPPILIPYPFATADHQEKNARSLEQRGAARIILNRDLSGERLFDEVDKLVSDQQALAEMKSNLRQIGHPDAAKKLARLVLSVAPQKD